MNRLRKGDFVKINDKNKYSGQDMRWTEEVTHKHTYKAGHKFYHFSDSKLNGFIPKTTCFFDEDVEISGHCYVLTFDHDLTVNVYSNEVRFDINEDSKIQYVGTVTLNFNKRVVWYDVYNRRQSCWATRDNRLKNY